MILSCISYKGGVGKSTISQNLAICMAQAGLNVCIVDADESQNTHYWIEARDASLPTIHVEKITNDKEIALKVRDLYQQFDYVIIDSPPSQSVIADKIIMLSHLVLVPVTPKGSSEVNTAEQFINQIRNLEAIKEKEILARFAINEFDPRPILHKEFVERFKEFPIQPLNTLLHRRVAYGEANLLGKGVYEHSDAKAKAEVIALYNEVISILETI